jgi:hypothetical protein
MPEGIFEFKGKEVRVGNYGGVAQGLPEIMTTPLPNLSGIDGGPGEPLSFEDAFKQINNRFLPKNFETWGKLVNENNLGSS